jgi:phosphatidylinositol dimannoside acyltransferase
VRRWLKALSVRGVFWRRLHHWAVRNVPWYLEPVLVAWFALFFYLGWPPGRHAVAHNLAAILPGSSPFANFFRGYRVVLSFSRVMTDTWGFTERGQEVDLEIEGSENLRALLEDDRGGIILTAHMGNYDLGSYLMTTMLDKPLTVVRIPELDPETETYARSRREQSVANLRVEYNVEPDALGLTLLDALRGGKLVAVQGDRAPEGVAHRPLPLFGITSRIPSGPFVLSMSARRPIYPLFVVRSGFRRYRIIAHSPIEVQRTSRDRWVDLEPPMQNWMTILHDSIRRYWEQWHYFEKIGT